MQTTAIALPILPGKLGLWHQLIAELQGPRAIPYAGLQMRLGIANERFFHQPTPEGDIAVWVFDATDPTAVMRGLASVGDAFGSWLLDQLEDVYGLTPEMMPHVKPGVLKAELGSRPAKPAGTGRITP